MARLRPLWTRLRDALAAQVPPATPEPVEKDPAISEWVDCEVMERHTSASAMVSTLPFRQLLATARVARTWHTRPAGRSRAPAFTVSHPRAFRRAYVEVWRLRPADVVECRDGAIEWLAFGVRRGRIDADGAFTAFDDEFHPTLSPKYRHEMAYKLHDQRVSRLKKRYQELAPDGTLVENDCPTFRFSSRAALKAFVTAAMKRFTARLHPDARRIMRSQGLWHASIATQLSAPGEAALRLRQAFDAYPALSTALMDDRFAKAIGQGASIVEFAADALQVAASVIRRYRGVSTARAFRGLAWMDAFRRVLPAIGALPDHLRPKSAADHRAAIEMFCMLPFARTPDAVRVLTRGMRVPLAQERRIAGLLHLEDPYRCLGLALGDDKPVATLLATLPLGRLVRLNVSWHRAHHAANAQAQGQVLDDEQVPWTPLLAAPFELEDLRIVELTTEADLREEGWRLAHCVGGYGPSCRSGHSRIVSVRTADGASLSTVELRRKTTAKGSTRLSIVQHHGVRNGAPCASAKRAITAMLRSIHGGRTPAQLVWPREISPQGPEWNSKAAQLVRERMDAFWMETFPSHANQIAAAAAARRERDEARRRAVAAMPRYGRRVEIEQAFEEDELPF